MADKEQIVINLPKELKTFMRIKYEHVCEYSDDGMLQISIHAWNFSGFIGPYI
jgi:hypothetical protein